MFITVISITNFENNWKNDCSSRKKSYFCKMVIAVTVIMITILEKTTKPNRHEILRQGKRTKTAS